MMLLSGVLYSPFKSLARPSVHDKQGNRKRLVMWEQTDRTTPTTSPSTYSVDFSVTKGGI